MPLRKNWTAKTFFCRTSRVDQLDTERHVPRPSSLPYKPSSAQNGKPSKLTPPRRAVSSSLSRKQTADNPAPKYSTISQCESVFTSDSLPQIRADDFAPATLGERAPLVQRGGEAEGGAGGGRQVAAVLQGEPEGAGAALRRRRGLREVLIMSEWADAWQIAGVVMKLSIN